MTLEKLRDKLECTRAAWEAELDPRTLTHTDRPNPHRRRLCCRKLGAWLDRSAWLETKDAADLALIACASARPQDR